MARSPSQSYDVQSSSLSGENLLGPFYQLAQARLAGHTQRKFSFEHFSRLATEALPPEVAIDRVLIFNHQYEDRKISAFKEQSRIRGVVLAVIRIYAPPGFENVVERWRANLEFRAQVVVRLDWDKISPATRRQLSRITDQDGILRKGAKVKELIEKVSGGSERGNTFQTPDRLSRCQRVDLRRIPFVAIDPPGTPDPEDAIYARHTRNGNMQLLISFPDATEKVPFGSLLYQRARKNPFTLYAARRAFPMLGQHLGTSEIVFSEGSDRAAFTLIVSIDRDGNVTKCDIVRSLIKNHASFTYASFGDVQRGADHPLANVVRALSESTYRIYQRERKKVPTEELGIDQEFRHVVPTSMKLAYRLIGDKLMERGIPALFRARQVPDSSALSRLVEKMKAVGIEASLSDFEEGTRVAALLMCLLDSSNFELYSRTLDLLQGRSHYSEEPIEHVDFGDRPKIEIKSRSLAGLTNQYQLAHMLSGSALLPAQELKRNRSILNRKEISLRALTARLSLLDYLRHRLSAVGSTTQVHIESIRGDKVYVESQGGIGGVMSLQGFPTPHCLRAGLSLMARFEGYAPDCDSFIFSSL